MSEKEKKDYTPLDGAILAAIKSGLTNAKAIDRAVKAIAKPYRPHAGEYDEWPTGYVVRCRMKALRRAGKIENVKGFGWRVAGEKETIFEKPFTKSATPAWMAIQV